MTESKSIDATTTREIDHWNIKVYDSNGCERETIRGINTTRKDTLMQIFQREEIQSQAIPYDTDGKYIHGKSESVNYGVGKELEKANE